MVQAHASISTDIVARYAADAAREVAGVSALVESRLPPHRGVRVSEEEGALSIEVHLRVEWDESLPDVGRAVQERIKSYLLRMANLEPAAVDGVVAEVAPPV